MKPLFFLLSLAFLLSCKEENITQIISPQDYHPPVLSWLTPPETDLRGTIALDIQVTDSSSITQVKLFVDGREQQMLTSPPYRFEIITDSLTDGVHLFEARALDEFGNLGISPILRANIMNSYAQGPQLIWVPDDYSTIQAAINAATDFDTIRVRDGIYLETCNLFGKGLWIESQNGPMHCTVNAGNYFNALFIPNSRYSATIRGFKIQGETDGLSIRADEGSTIYIYNNIFTSDIVYTFFLTNTSGGYINNNLFSGSNTAVQIGYFLGDFTNNILQNVSDIALWNSAIYENPIFHGYNIFWNNVNDYNNGFVREIGEFNADPLLDLVNGRLEANSPALDAGNPFILDRDSSRSDIGPFGGPWAY